MVVNHAPIHVDVLALLKEQQICLPYLVTWLCAYQMRLQTRCSIPAPSDKPCTQTAPQQESATFHMTADLQCRS